MPAGLAGADDGTNCMSPLTRQAMLEGDLSMKEEVVAELDFVIRWSEDRPLRS